MKKNYDSFDIIFNDIYNNNCIFLIKYLFMLVRDLDVAEDLAHDIFLRIYKSRNMNLADIKIRNYIKKSARNIAIDYIRKKNREEVRNEKIIPEIEEFNDKFYSLLEDSVIDGEVITTVNDVLESFSEKNRKIFISRIFENKTRKQISEEEKISSYAIKRIEDEILYVLKRKLRDFK